MKHIAIFQERGNALPRFLVQGYLEPEEIGLAIEALIDMLDKRSGDPDLEEDDPAGGDIVDERHDSDGDEADGDPWAEDEFGGHDYAGPGCPLSDPGGLERTAAGYWAA